VTTIEESRLRFQFDDTWQVIKYDGHADHLKIARLHRTKAVDFVAIHRARDLFFIEVKNFRHYRIENKVRVEKLQADQELDLATEVAMKVRDTIAGIMAALHRGSPEYWGPVVACLRKTEPPVKLLLWLEQDLPRDPPGRASNREQTLNQFLKKQLAWLTTKVLLASRGDLHIPDGLVVDLMAEVEQDPS